MLDTQYRQLLSIGRQLVEELDPEVVLHRLLEVAREVTGAQYAAVGVLDDDRKALRRFIVSGIDDETRRRIGDLPLGRGVLGELIRDPRPLRLASVGDHPRSYGFPPGHPPMETFLGAPIVIRGEAFGNIYLTEKAGGEFGSDDEDALVVLADWAAVAIENARLHEGLSSRKEELERAVTTLTATTSIAKALAGETDLARVLELIAKRGRAVIDARSLLILLADGDDLVMAAGAGEIASRSGDVRVAIEGSLAGQVLTTGRAERLTEINRARFERSGLGRLGISLRSGLFVPLVFRQRPIGVLAALDRAGEGDFTPDDARLLEAFAVSAATAVGTAQGVSDEQRRRSLQATEAERRRWARELHDDTLQELAALRLGLAAGSRADDVDDLRAAMHRAMAEVDGRIAALRGLIADVRPASLDQLGLEPAIEDLVERMRTRGLDIALSVDLGDGRGRAASRHIPEIEDAVYRLTQEALSNVLKHAGAKRVAVTLSESGGNLELRVQDDGRGFTPEASHAGFGLVGMRERAELLGGRIDVRSSQGGGTLVRVTLPAERRGGAAPARERSLKTG